MSARKASIPASAQMPPARANAGAFENLFRDAYQGLLRDAIFAGGNPHEAEDTDTRCRCQREISRWSSPRAMCPIDTTSP